MQSRSDQDWLFNQTAGGAIFDHHHIEEHLVSLSSHYFSLAECQAIMRLLLKLGLLSASGVMSSMARAIVFCPLMYQGLPDFYVFQGVQHIEKINC
jgi:hypothetical protein